MSPTPMIRTKAAALPLTVHIVERMAPGGIETLVLDMVKGLPGAHRVISLAGRPSELLQAWPRLIRLGDTLEGFNRQPGLQPRLVRELAARLKVLAPAAVVLHHIGPLLYGGLAARLARVPRILHVEHDAWHYDSARRRAVGRAAFALVRPVRVAVSDEIATHVTRRLGATDVTVIPPGIDMDVFKPRDRAAARVRLGLPVEGTLIGTSGRLVAVKSQVTLIEALAELGRGNHARLRLVIAGEGPERAALAQRAADLGVADAVHLLGHRDDVADVLPAFDVYALPSLNEGLPRSVLEAQAVGLPVVASRVGALPQAVCPRSGALVPPGNPAALAAALASLIASPAAPAVPRAFVADRFSLSHTLLAFDRLLSH
jgi:glycosyltransferase involved in cell wall biosynthesis